MTLPASRLERLRSLEGNHFWSIGRDRLVDTLIDRYRMTAPFLDAGAGTGHFARQLGPECLWFDTGPVEPGGIRASVLDMPFPSESIGTLLARDVLEHVDDKAALAEARRVLRRGGHLLVTVPAWPSLWGPRDEAAGHLRRYRRAGLRRVVEQQGFRVEEMRGYQFLLLPLMISTRLLARITGEEGAEREEGVGPFNGLLTRVNLFEAGLANRRWPAPPTGSSLVLVGVKS